MLPIVVAMCCLVTGNVHAPSGAPLANAHIVVRGGVTRETTSDAKGDFSIIAGPGPQNVNALVQGYSPVTIALSLDHDTKLDVTLESLDSPKLRQIGSVTVDGRLTPITGTIPSITLTRADFDRLGEDRVVQGLAALPSATFARPDGGAARDRK